MVWADMPSQTEEETDPTTDLVSGPAMHNERQTARLELVHVHSHLFTSAAHPVAIEEPCTPIHHTIAPGLVAQPASRDAQDLICDTYHVLLTRHFAWPAACSCIQLILWHGHPLLLATPMTSHDAKWPQRFHA